MEFADLCVCLWQKTKYSHFIALSLIHFDSCHAGEEREMVIMRGHSGAVFGTKFTADNNFLLSASEDTTGY